MSRKVRVVKSLGPRREVAVCRIAQVIPVAGSGWNRRTPVSLTDTDPSCITGTALALAVKRH